MPTKRRSRIWTATQIKKHIQNVQDVIAKQKQEKLGEQFIAATPEEIKRELKSIRSIWDETSLMISFMGWNNTNPGGTVNFNLVIYNPGPTEIIWIFAHLWVGSGNIDPNIGSFLTNVDTRFPRLTQPAQPGLTLAAGAHAQLSFALKVPSTVEQTSYFGNICLMHPRWITVGDYLGRGCFVFEVK